MKTYENHQVLCENFGALLVMKTGWGDPRNACFHLPWNALFSW